MVFQRLLKKQYQKRKDISKILKTSMKVSSLETDLLKEI